MSCWVLRYRVKQPALSVQLLFRTQEIAQQHAMQVQAQLGASLDHMEVVPLFGEPEVPPRTHRRTPSNGRGMPSCASAPSEDGGGRPHVRWATPLALTRFLSS